MKTMSRDCFYGNLTRRFDVLIPGIITTTVRLRHSGEAEVVTAAICAVARYPEIKRQQAQAGGGR